MVEVDLPSVVEAVYSARGDDVLDILLGKLVEFTGVDYALVSKLVDDQPSKARTLSFFSLGGKAENFEYELLGGPCEQVHGRHTCIFNKDVQEAFPADSGIRQKKVESYIGIPLFAAGDEPIGIVAVMHRKPFDDPESICDILKIFASRVASELDWSRREAALKRMERRFRNLVEGSIQGIFIHRDFRLLFVNQKFAQMLGYESPEALTAEESLLDLFLPEERDRMRDLAGRRLSDEQLPDRHEVRMCRRDGTVLWLENVIRVVGWEGQRAIQCTSMDITERKIAEEQLHGMVENAFDGIYRSNEVGKLLWANAALARMAGYETGDELVAAISDLSSDIYVDPDDRKALLRQLAETGYVRDFVARFKGARTGQTMWCSTNCRLYRGLDGNTYIDGVVRDITEFRRNEERMRRVEKMQAIGQLTGGIAHDFNNLLGIVIGNLDMLEEDAGDDERLGRPIATALRAALRGAELTRRLVAFSNQSQEVAQPRNIAELIGNMDTALAKIIDTGIALRSSLSDGLWMTDVDAGDFEDVILNLVSNACDAMPDGGTLTIETNNLTLLAAEPGEMDDIPPGDYVVLRVTDDGCGMPKEVIDQMFEPFFTTKKVGRGAGLGMSLVYGFVRRAAGFIKVHSKPGDGTTVRIFLPRSKGPKVAPAYAREADTMALRGSEVVLVVDDEADVAALAKATLERLGYRALVAGDADDALAELGRQPRVDVLFTDIVMPGTMTGLELAEHARKEYPHLKILLTSGFSDKIAPLRRHSGLLESLLAKPYRQADMVQRIRNLLDHGSGVPLQSV